LSKEGIVPIVNVVMSVARLHGTALALAELEKLLPERSTAEDLATALEHFPQLSDTYVVRDGFVLPKSDVSPNSSARGEALRRSMANISAARTFASRLTGRGLEIMAVSGSNSYLSASEGDDLDLFCVTSEGKMWVFLLRALAITRLRRLLGRCTPQVTFSFVMDRKRAAEIFSMDNGALFARDALMARVVSGHLGYAALMDQASWIEKYFPKLYRSRENGDARRLLPKRQSGRCNGLLNRVLYLMVGSFIRVKASLHNRMLARDGNDMALFRLRIGPDHLIYESKRYQALRSIYSNVESVEETGLRARDAEEGD